MQNTNETYTISSYNDLSKIDNKSRDVSLIDDISNDLSNMSISNNISSQSLSYNSSKETAYIPKKRNILK
jgi:hypothetical protein